VTKSESTLAADTGLSASRTSASVPHGARSTIARWTIPATRSFGLRVDGSSDPRPRDELGFVRHASDDGPFQLVQPVAASRSAATTATTARPSASAAAVETVRMHRSKRAHHSSARSP
jgi:hypothetical protein